MKLKGITSGTVSLQLGPSIGPGAIVDFGDEIPEKLRAEIEECARLGLLAIVQDPPPAPGSEKKKGR